MLGLVQDAPGVHGGLHDGGDLVGDVRDVAPVPLERGRRRRRPRRRHAVQQALVAQQVEVVVCKSVRRTFHACACMHTQAKIELINASIIKS